mmetsp:Transcript_27631/g.61711  ORF Transcript_27631/g.61711 Transcript_27631/m.61711 type:complete len:257 (-) Transcript_27631:83-853(-)
MIANLFTVPPFWIKVSTGSLVFFGILDRRFHKIGDIETVGLVHSMLASFLSVYTIAADLARGVDWPIFCDASAPAPPATAALLPMITCGYAVFDVIVGFRANRIDYFLHGVALFFLCGTACHYEVGAVLPYGLVMECSTVFLNLRSLKKNWIDVAFVSSFVFFRIGLVPFYWYKWTTRFRAIPLAQRCLSEGVYYAMFYGGAFFTALNVYWGQIIVRRLIIKTNAGASMISREWKPEPGQFSDVNELPASFREKRD